MKVIPAFIMRLFSRLRSFGFVQTQRGACGLQSFDVRLGFADVERQGCARRR